MYCLPLPPAAAADLQLSALAIDEAFDLGESWLLSEPTSEEAGEMDMADVGLIEGDGCPSRMTSESWKR